MSEKMEKPANTIIPPATGEEAAEIVSSMAGGHKDEIMKVEYGRAIDCMMDVCRNLDKLQGMLEESIKNENADYFLLIKMKSALSEVQDMCSANLCSHNIFCISDIRIKMEGIQAVQDHERLTWGEKCEERIKYFQDKRSKLVENCGFMDVTDRVKYYTDEISMVMEKKRRGPKRWDL